MSDNSFVDHYETLQVSPNADLETIERVFRHLAKRYHPDNQTTGDAERFHRLVEAHRLLTNAEARAAYDVRYEDGKVLEQGLMRDAAGAGVYEDDRVLRERLLALLYVQRRRDVEDPAIGNIELERLLSCPAEHLEFHMWYLKEKKLVERTSRGFAITALGIDEAEAARDRLPRDRLLAERAESDAEDRARIQIGAGLDTRWDPQS